jgi:hypothetical protein
MYPAIKQTTDKIAQQAFLVWQQGGDHNAVIIKLCKESNVTDWLSTVQNSLNLLIKSN